MKPPDRELSCATGDEAAVTTPARDLDLLACPLTSGIWQRGYLLQQLHSAALKTGRTCGDCSLCCKLTEIEELNKPEHIWCKHCKPGKGGCTIYNTRPQVCRDFVCGWLTNDVAFGDEWKPSASKIIVTASVDSHDNHVLKFAVDRSVPDRWREEPWYSTIKRIACTRLNGSDESRPLLTHVLSHERTWLVLPDRDVDVFGKFCALAHLGGYPAWDVVVAESAEHLNRVLDVVKADPVRFRQMSPAQRVALVAELR
jgi:hypothetical protein